MEPLRVDVDFPPSSSATVQELLRKGRDRNGATSYEVANFEELQFPDFRLSKRLGRGSYGTVMPCHFRGRQAAAKLLDANVDFKMVRVEAELLHGLRHENIVELYALFHGEMSGLVLELMEGGSLGELLHQQKHIAYQTCHVLNWAVQATKALGYLHSHSFIHRDIKPSNMLLTRDYIRLKLCDFGTVAELQTSMTNNRGTAAWMAPEVFRGRKYDQRCDIFSLGICLWEMIARRQPFAELVECNPMAVLWKGLPEPLQQLMTRCWADDPNDRPFLEEVQGTLEAFLEMFPDAALLPLVDRSTGRPAFANSIFVCDPAASHPLPNPFVHSTALSPLWNPNANAHLRASSHDISSTLRQQRHAIQTQQQQQQLLFMIRSNPIELFCFSIWSSPPPFWVPSASYGIGSSRSFNDIPSCTSPPPCRYSPNTSPLGIAASSPYRRQSSYSPCLAEPVHPPLVLALPNETNDEYCPQQQQQPINRENNKKDKKKRSNGIIKLLRGLKRELVNE
ncbi:Mitogen-activated protein kinase kinase kinase 7 [Globodera pallida]|nr:Mitogen-activated protein kinase kinase kinase 7 [Globodera pallida]